MCNILKDKSTICKIWLIILEDWNFNYQSINAQKNIGRFRQGKMSCQSWRYSVMCFVHRINLANNSDMTKVTSISSMSLNWHLCQILLSFPPDIFRVQSFPVSLPRSLYVSLVNSVIIIFVRFSLIKLYLLLE